MVMRILIVKKQLLRTVYMQRGEGGWMDERRAVRGICRNVNFRAGGGRGGSIVILPRTVFISRL